MLLEQLLLLLLGVQVGARIVLPATKKPETTAEKLNWNTASSKNMDAFITSSILLIN